MTGTATTEANEFKEIYKLDVLTIPTHRPSQRQDFNDEMYMTEREKYNAILKDVNEIHQIGRPILIGTESVEVSEKLARIFKQNKLNHTVLNAKQHEREAEIIAHAGEKGAITIATNMAGRGTDIKLGSGVAEIGGLHVIGTTRHQSRRIDRQLRGRCSRLGDPGSSKFYISFEDSLMRLFASPTLNTMLQKFRPPEGEPISAGILNKSIETAQKRIEQRNYMIRKHTLEYDDVMNKQRQEIYAFRNEILHSQDPSTIAIELLENLIYSSGEHFLSPDNGLARDPEGFRQWLLHHFPVSFEEGFFEDEGENTAQSIQKAVDKVLKAFKDKLASENKPVNSSQSPMLENSIPESPPSNEVIRSVMIRKIDNLWQEHLLAMDYLRSDVHLRTIGNKDPLMEFKKEAFLYFEELSKTLKAEIAQDLFKFQIVYYHPLDLKKMISELQLETNRSFLSEMEEEPSASEIPDENAEKMILKPLVAEPKSGRNELCPCNSGKKYKKCCGQQNEQKQD